MSRPRDELLIPSMLRIIPVSVGVYICSCSENGVDLERYNEQSYREREAWEEKERGVSIVSIDCSVYAASANIRLNNLWTETSRPGRLRRRFEPLA